MKLTAQPSPSWRCPTGAVIAIFSGAGVWLTGAVIAISCCVWLLPSM